MQQKELLSASVCGSAQHQPHQQQYWHCLWKSKSLFLAPLFNNSTDPGGAKEKQQFPFLGVFLSQL